MRPSLNSRIAQFVALVAAMFAASSALAITPANTQLSNTATLTYDGNATGVTAGTTVTVTLITANVVIASPYSPPSDQSKPENASDFVATYNVIAQNNGFDTYTVTSVVQSNTNVDSPGAFVANGGVDLELGATALSVISDGSSTITVPSDGVADSEVNGIEQNDTVVIGTTAYTVTGTVTDTGSGNVSLTLSGTPAASLPVGTGVFEATSFTVTTTDVGSVATPPGAAFLTIRTTIDNSVDAPAFFDDLQIDIVQIDFDKYVRCISDCDDTGGATSTTHDPDGGGPYTYYQTGVTAEPGGVLEYLLVVNNPTASDITGAVLADVLDDFTSYDTGTTIMNGAAVADEGGGGFPLDSGADDGGLILDDGAAFVDEGDGVVGGGSTVHVVYRATVD